MKSLSPISFALVPAVAPALAGAVLLALLFQADPAQAQRLPFATPGENAAAIIGSPAKPASDIYDVEFIQIDGRNLVSSRSIIWLEPGEYTVKARPMVRNPPGGQGRLRMRDRHEEGYNEIELVLEAGKSYYIGAHYDRSDRRAPYQIVLYRVQE